MLILLANDNERGMIATMILMGSVRATWLLYVFCLCFDLKKSENYSVFANGTVSFSILQLLISFRILF